MAGKNNLKPITSTSRARELGSKGGKKTQENARKKKQLKEYMEMLLELEVKDTDTWNKLAAKGIPVKEINNKMLLVTALFDKAIVTGDVQAFKEIRGLIGEDVEQQSKDTGAVNALMSAIKGESGENKC